MKKTILKRIQLYVFILTIIFSATTLYAQKYSSSKKSVEQEIKTVEGGLQPVVQVEGEPKIRFQIADRMKYYNVPGVSVAVVRNGKVRWAKGYGVANPNTNKNVDANTLFQAGSISKPIAALAALKLVDEGKVDLDKDVNFYLKDWKVSENEYTKKEKVTLRRLLTHTAGMTVHGFPGYTQEDNFPSDIKVLDGKGNTGKIFVDTLPGSKWRYSGGGYTVMEKLVEDVSGMSFDIYLKKKILKPLRMSNSTYTQPLPKNLHANASAAFNRRGKLYKGLWNNYPEQAAAGLWTTPTDLAKYCIEIQKALAGKSNKVLSKEMVQKMLTKDKNNWGLGPQLGGDGDNLVFRHGGKNAGFTNIMFAFAKKGDAVIVMTNADRGGTLYREVLRAISGIYNWNVFNSKTIKTIKLTKQEMHAFLGKYEASINSRKLSAKLLIEDSQLIVHNLDNDDKMQIRAVGDLEFIELKNGRKITFQKGAGGMIEGFNFNNRFTFKKMK